MWFKDPDSTLDYSFDWWKWLNKTDTVKAATITATLVGNVQAGVVVIVDTTFTNSSVTALVTGGEVGTVYDIHCRIETADGLADERTEQLTVQER